MYSKYYNSENELDEFDESIIHQSGAAYLYITAALQICVLQTIQPKFSKFKWKLNSFIAGFSAK